MKAEDGKCYLHETPNALNKRYFFPMVTNVCIYDSLVWRVLHGEKDKTRIYNRALCKNS